MDICFCIQSVVVSGFGWHTGENLVSYRHLVRKRSSILITFTHNCGHSSLIIHWNLTTGSFLKVYCNVESETLSINFSWCYIKIHILNLEWINYTCMILQHCALVILKTLVYDLCRSSKYWSTLKYNAPKSHLYLSSPISLESLKILGSFQAGNLSLAINTSFEVIDLLCSIFVKMSII